MGSFERTDGYVTAGARATAIVPTDSSDRWYEAPPGQLLAHADATAMVGDEAGFAFAHNERTALISTPIGGIIAAPFVHAKSHWQVVVIDDADAYSGAESGGAGAVGTFEYNVDPEYTENLEFHGHLYLAVYGGEVISGNGGVGIGANVDAWIGGEASISAFRSDGVWYVNGSAPDPNGNTVNISESSPDGVNIHIHYTVPITGQSFQQEIGSRSSSYVIILNNSDGMSQIIWSGVAAAWGYVTGEGQDLTPGDFNADGLVDQDDYQMWADKDPRADADEDGDIDTADFDIWAANSTDVLIVSTQVDETDGDYSYGDLSLREAVSLAASNTGHDAIVFAPSVQNIVLTMGQLSISNTNEVEIIGPGADELTIDANGASNVFSIAGGGSTAIESTISRMTLTGAVSSGVFHNDVTGTHDLVLDKLSIVDNGIGVYQARNGDVTISDSTISDNYNSGVQRSSSTIASSTLSVTNSAVENNGSYGISKAQAGGSIVITGSEISGNNTRAVAGATGIRFKNTGAYSGTLTILSSTVAENNGAGVYIEGASANISNSTVSSNEGVGLSVSQGDVTLTNVTVTQNRVTSSTDTAGLYAGSGGIITLHNTIVAQNFAGPSGSEVASDLGRNIDGTPGSFVGSSSYNLLGVVGNSGLSSANNNIILGASGDPGLAPLASYGGKTRTHALLDYSDAIDSGDNAKATALGLTYDQRELERIVDWDGDLNPRVDIGAFELALSELYE